MPEQNILEFQAVPVISNVNRGDRSMVSKAVIVDNSPVQSIGAVDFRAGFGVNAGLPNDITIRFDNSAGVAPATFMFGDPNGLIAAITGATYETPEAPATSIASFVASMGKNPLTFKSLNYRITTGNPSQFSNRLQYADADMDGSLSLKPINISSAQRNTQFNDKILTLGTDIYMDDTTGIILVVAAGTVVEMDFSFRNIFRAGAAV